jgi:two-component system response regulator HydG
VDIVISDVRLPDISGIDFCEKIKSNRSFQHIPVILITGFGDVEMAVQAMAKGAFYFLTKPIRYVHLFLLIQRALENSRLRRELAALKDEMEIFQKSCKIIGKSNSMRKLFEKILQVAPHDVTVLVQGNSGTGKELVARAIHNKSLRKDAAFVAVDCVAISENLLESELFGHVKGAFTGAMTARKGIFLSANSGTLFLDEIGNLPISLQTKLLRVLQENEISPVGSDKIISVDVRIIAATNIDLLQMVEKGEFRKDLYFRLNVLNLKLPDLKDRIEDVPLLAQHFLDKPKKEKKLKKLAKSTLKVLMNHSWPGNIRELENVMEHALIVSSGSEILVEDLPENLQEGVASSCDFETTRPLSLREQEKKYIISVLKYAEYNQSKASQILEIDRKSLWRKIKKYGIIIPKTEQES